MGDHVIIVPDTNVLLHSQPLDRIPWRDLVKATSVEIVLVSQVLRELDAKKNGESEKLRRRAQRVLSEIKRWIPSVSSTAVIADGVSIRVHVNEPPVTEGLDLSVPDDRIIACALSLRGSYPVLVASGDITMGYKAEGQGLLVQTVPDEHRIQDDEQPKKVISAPRPRLVAALFAEDSTSPTSNLSVRRGLSARHLVRDAERGLRDARTRAAEAERKRAEQEARREAQLRTSGLRGLGGLALRHPFEGIEMRDPSNPVISEPSVETWERYVENVRGFDAHHENTFALSIGIVNEGEAPADDILVEFSFPEHVDVALHEPRLPSPPRRERLSDLLLHTGFNPHVAAQLAEANDSLDLERDDGGPFMKLKVRRLMHSKALIHRVWVQMSYAQLGGFKIGVNVLAASPPWKNGETLNVRFER